MISKPQECASYRLSVTTLHKMNSIESAETILALVYYHAT
jgi:hypothetical protein